MPIYEYKCINCDISFESLVIQIKGERDIFCPNCKSPNVKRQLSCCEITNKEDEIFSFISSKLFQKEFS